MVRGKVAEVGDTTVAQNGYHYTRTEEGWKLTSRLLMEQKLGRPLLKTERVIFKNNNRKDIRPDNLEVRTVTNGTKSLLNKRANLEAKIEELQAQLDEVNEQIKQIQSQQSSH